MLCIGAASALAPAATSANIPPTSSSVSQMRTSDDYLVSWEGTVPNAPTLGLRATVFDARDGRALIRPDYSASLAQTPMQASLICTPTPSGFYLTLSVNNQTGQPQDVPLVVLSQFTTFQAVRIWDFRTGTSSSSFTPTGTLATVSTTDYPSDTYSPVLVFGDDRHTVGISLLYDVIAYDQSARMQLAFQPGVSPWFGPGYTIRCTVDGAVPPGAQRTYRYCVRFARAGTHWLHTLTPYRDHFRSTFGGVQYTFDPRPVMGVSLSILEQGSGDNRRAFSYAATRRPDRFGFRPWVEAITEMSAQRHYPRTILWAVTGLWPDYPFANYPSTLFSGIENIPLMRDTLPLLAELPQRGLDVGYYWGQPTFVMRGWNNAGRDPFNPDNPEHIRWAAAELDKARELGATAIGLDAFVVASPRTQYRWLWAMTRRYPEMKFVVELSGADFLHTIAANYYTDNQTAEPDTLAHFLNPGHETWMAGWMQRQARERGVPRLTQEQMVEEALAFQRDGYVYIDLQGISMPLGASASLTVANSVIPPELRLDPAPPRTNYNPAITWPASASRPTPPAATPTSRPTSGATATTPRTMRGMIRVQRNAAQRPTATPLPTPTNSTPAPPAATPTPRGSSPTPTTQRPPRRERRPSQQPSWLQPSR
jgi:hypothetical protein